MTPAIVCAAYESGIHSQPPHDGTQDGSGGEGSFLRSTSDGADNTLTPMERETAIELLELREAWYEVEGMHSLAAYARSLKDRLIAGRKEQS